MSYPKTHFCLAILNFSRIIVRLMRILVVTGVVVETDVETYAAAPTSMALTVPGLRDGAKHMSVSPVVEGRKAFVNALQLRLRLHRTRQAFPNI